MAYISLKIAKLGKIGNYDVIMTSYVGYLYFFWYGKRRPISILWYQISIPQVFIFQVNRGGGCNNPTWLVALQKINPDLVRGGLKDIIIVLIVGFDLITSNSGAVFSVICRRSQTRRTQ